MTTLRAVFDRYEDVLLALVLTVPRIHAFLESSQLLSATAVPGLARNGAVLCLVLFAAPANLAAAHGFDHTIASSVFVFAKEYAIGAILGYLVAWIFWVAQAAGTFIDDQRGASIAASVDPLLGAQSSPIGDLFSLTFLTYLFATAGVLKIVGFLFQSFALWPLFAPWPLLAPDFPSLVLSVLDDAMRLGFAIAAPVLAAMFLAEFALAMVSRFAPQIQVFVLAMPIKSLLAIFMLIFYAFTLFPFVGAQIDRVDGYADRLYRTIAFGQALRAGSAPGRAAP